MWQAIKLFLLIVPVFLLLDFLWIGVLMNTFYQKELGELARRVNGSLAPRWEAAVLVYVLIPGGIILFVRPLLQSHGTYFHAFAWGAVFGLVVYGVYDLTNRAVLQNWSLLMTVADISWGCALCGLVSVVMRFIENKLFV